MVQKGNHVVPVVCEMDGVVVGNEVLNEAINR